MEEQQRTSRVATQARDSSSRRLLGPSMTRLHHGRAICAYCKHEQLYLAQSYRSDLLVLIVGSESRRARHVQKCAKLLLFAREQ